MTVSFALFGLMVGLRATHDEPIEVARMDRLDVDASRHSQAKTLKGARTHLAVDQQTPSACSELRAAPMQ